MRFRGTGETKILFKDILHGGTGMNGKRLGMWLAAGFASMGLLFPGGVGAKGPGPKPPQQAQQVDAQGTPIKTEPITSRPMVQTRSSVPPTVTDQAASNDGKAVKDLTSQVTALKDEVERLKQSNQRPKWSPFTLDK
jgi:hypothetical protein